MNKLILDSPIMINGKEVKELTYDALEITTDDYLEACAISASMARGNNIAIKMMENDHALHLCLGFMAIKAVNPQYDIADLKRIKGFDAVKVADIGRVFIFGKSAESEENTSEKQSETIAEHSTQAQKSLEECDSSIS